MLLQFEMGLSSIVLRSSFYLRLPFNIFSFGFMCGCCCMSIILCLFNLLAWWFLYVFIQSCSTLSISLFRSPWRVCVFVCVRVCVELQFLLKNEFSERGSVTIWSPLSSQSRASIRTITLLLLLLILWQ